MKVNRIHDKPSGQAGRPRSKAEESVVYGNEDSAACREGGCQVEGVRILETLAPKDVGVTNDGRRKRLKECHAEEKVRGVAAALRIRVALDLKLKNEAADPLVHAGLNEIKDSDNSERFLTDA